MSGGVSEHFTAQVPDGLDADFVELARTGGGAIAFACRLAGGAGVVPPALPQTREGYAVVLTGSLHRHDHDPGELPAGSLIHFDDLAELSVLVAGAESELAVVVFAPAVGSRAAAAG